MKKGDELRFGQIMAGLQVGLGKRGSKLSEKEVEFYFNTLKDIDIETLEKAASELINTKRIRELPTPGEIREKAGMSLEQKALKAWHLALETAKKYSHSSVKFEDPVIHTAIIKNWGSWNNFTSLDLWGNNSNWLQKLFIQSYKTYFSDPIHPKYLPGYFSDCINFSLDKDLVFIESKETKLLKEAKIEEPF